MGIDRKDKAVSWAILRGVQGAILKQLSIEVTGVSCPYDDVN